MLKLEVNDGDLMDDDQVMIIAEVTVLPALSINDITVEEGNSGDNTVIMFTVSLNQPGTSDVTVDFSTEDATATAGTDYVASSGTLTFPAGTTTPQTITVSVNGDDMVELDETFFVDLSNPVNATIADSQGWAPLQATMPPRFP